MSGTMAGSIPACPVNNNKEIKLNKTNLFGVVDVLTGDCVESMKSLPDESIQTCITSPPYFGLRQYLFDKAVILRNNITEEEKEYVEQELKRLGIEPRKKW